ncbi:Uncharacterised protein [Yersinia frederiksenii]|nr:Uncharacterised protein [Yersinia frederiksenii]CNL97643.1 Uncharacterised protein [Yersinia frederiksenii]
MKTSLYSVWFALIMACSLTPSAIAEPPREFGIGTGWQLDGSDMGSECCAPDSPPLTRHVR